MGRNDDAADIDPTTVDRIGRILSEIEASDFEAVDPPADLWDDIAMSIARDEAERHVALKRAPHRESTIGTIVEYAIDGNDVLTDVGRDWAAFARDNGAPGLASSVPTHRLWDSFDRNDVREVWQLLVDRVRSTQRQVRVPLRCDAAHARRWFEMTVTPEADSGVRFRCALVFEEPREPVALLDAGSSRNGDADPILACSWCGRGRFGSTWLDVEELVHVERLLEQPSLPPISYGICEPCRHDMSADLLLAAQATDS